ncbi:hypothetical protein QQG74_11850 [Micromonospora sp. FIMYZ51]|uniref:hypothetical protein n=1 Tax=Micromonospora sp. FIMYZ51 TaxID=3051832 RepID=UPI00311E4B6B
MSAVPSRPSALRPARRPPPPRRIVRPVPDAPPSPARVVRVPSRRAAPTSRPPAEVGRCRRPEHQVPGRG